jgi:hypothetical protein
MNQKQIKGDTAMSLIDDEVKAARLARVFMNDIGAYFPELVEKGIKEDNIFDLLHDQIEEARIEFNKRVIPEFAASKMMDIAVVDVLIKRAYKYKKAIV